MLWKNPNELFGQTQYLQNPNQWNSFYSSNTSENFPGNVLSMSFCSVVALMTAAGVISFIEQSNSALDVSTSQKIWESKSQEY